MDRVQRLCEWVVQRRYPAVAVIAGLVLTLPSLWVGLQADDWFIRATVLRSHPLEGVLDNPWEPYTYLDGDPANNHKLIDRGWLPWWTDLESRASLARPLTALTQMLDHRAWPDVPALMHVQSLAWFGFLIAAAAILYRRLMKGATPAWCERCGRTWTPSPTLTSGTCCCRSEVPT